MLDKLYYFAFLRRSTIWLTLAGQVGKMINNDKKLFERVYERFGGQKHLCSDLVVCHMFFFFFFLGHSCQSNPRPVDYLRVLRMKLIIDVFFLVV